MEILKNVLFQDAGNIDLSAYEDGQVVESCENCKEPIAKVRLIVDQKRVCKQICSCKKKELELKELSNKQLEKQNELGKYFASCWSNNEFKECTFEKWDFERCPQEHFDKAKAYASSFDNMLKHNIGMLVIGSSGNGKTYTSAAILNAIKEKGYTGMIIQLPQLIELADSFKTNRETNLTETAFYKKMRNADLLVIDDFGVEHKFSKEKVYAIIDERLKEKLPLIVTTNLTSEELFNYHPRLISRLTESCSISMVYNNPDNRKEMKSRKTNYFSNIFDKWFNKNKGL